MRVQVNINDDMVHVIDGYARKFGVSRSALCSMLVGQGIMGLERSAVILDGLEETMKRTIIDEISKDDDGFSYLTNYHIPRNSKKGR